MSQVMEMFTEVKSEIAQVTDARVRHIEEMKIGQIVRQGDIYITMVDESHAHGGICESHQLAMGTSKGSRHMADQNFMVHKGTKLPEGFLEGTFIGPFIKSEVRAQITHPEHSWVSLPAGCYQVTHQTDLKTRQRALD